MIEEKINELGYQVPEAPKPLAAYIPALIVDDLVFTAGQLPMASGELKFKGKIGQDVTEEEGQKAAELCALNCLSVIKSVAGTLEKIERIVKVTVFVNSADGFTMQPKVANGASEFFVKIFGEEGKHVRSAVGVNELPLNAACEVEIIAKLKKA
ncbi:MAG: RidA family protein [Bacillota bacterium]